MKDLHDSVALVTGAASGIGRATATVLASHGCRLILADIDEHGLDDVAAELGDRCTLTHRVDVSDRDAMRDFARRVHDRFTAVDVLINNAGVGHAGGLESTSLEDLDWVLGINLMGVLHGCHFFVPPMLARGRGQVVNVSSTLGFWAMPRTLAYSTSKFAVFGYSQSLRSELAHRGVGVSTICPGVIRTRIIDNGRVTGDASEEARSIIASIFERRDYGPEKVARAIVGAVRRDRAVVVVTPEARIMYVISRWAPWLGRWIGRRMERWAGRAVGRAADPAVTR